MSAPELRARPVRSLLMAGTVAVGVALLTAMHVATQSIVTGFAEDLERLAGTADLQVTFGTGETGFSEELRTRIAAQPFTAHAAALVRSQVTFESGIRETVELFGIDLLQDDILDIYDVRVLAREPDDFTILNDPRGVFVTNVIADERGLSVGSRVRLSAVDGVHDYTVRGIIAAEGLAAFLNGRLVSMYLPAAQPVAGKKGDLTASMIDQIDVKLKDPTGIESARRSLEDMLGPGFRVDTPVQRRMIGEHTVEGLRATLVGMSSLALLAALFIVFASTTTMVAQRLPAMATLVSIGTSPSALIQAVVVEAAVLGAAGSAAGTVLGLFLASFVGEDAAAGMGLNYSLPFDAARIAWDPVFVFGIHPAGGILSAACSAFLPARRLRTVTPFTLQRDDDQREQSSDSRITALVAGVLGLVGTSLLAYGVSRGDPGAVSFGGILFIAASVLAVLPLLRRLWAASTPFLTKLYGAPGRIAAENLLRSIDRSLVTASAIALSVAIAVGAGSLVQSFRASVAGWYGFSGDALISSRSVTGGWLAAPSNRSLQQQVEGLSGVVDVQTLRVLQGQPYERERVALVGLSDRMLSRAIKGGELQLDYSYEQALSLLSAGSAVAVSRNFVTHFGSKGSIDLPSPAGEMNLPVVAVIPDYVSDQGSIVLGRDLLATRWFDSLVNYYVVELRGGTTVDQLAAEVDRGVEGAGSLAVTPTEAMIARVDGLIGKAFADIDTIKLLVLFLTAVGIADLVISNALWRKRELAVLRLVGLTDGQMIRIALLEGLCVTIGAAIAGALVGIVCAWLWVHYNYPVLVGYVLDLQIAWGTILISIVLAGASAAVSAITAARYSLRQPALQVVRYE